MVRVSRLTLFVSIAVAAVLTLSGQQAPQKPAMAASRSIALQNPFLAPVSGTPVTATFVINTERTRPDGSTEALGATFQVARDSGGRISHELRELKPPSSAGESPSQGAVLYDPRTHLSQTIDDAKRTDVEREIRLPVNWFLTADGTAEFEELGRKTIAGVKVRGVRRMWRAPGQFSPTGQPWQTSIETWFSDRLHMTVSERRTNPDGSVVSVIASQIDRQQPAASLFKAPLGYQVVRLKPLVFYRGHVGTGWTGIPPDYDPNDGLGRQVYPGLIR
jgi:hypothetical protein